MTIEAAAREWAEAAQTRPPEYTNDEVVGGVRLHCYSSFTQVILDGGQGGDWAEYGMVECFANIADTVTLIVEDDDDDDARGVTRHAGVTLTPAEARWLGAWLVAQAEQAERRRDGGLGR
jgi:hypothetical protein